MSSGRTARLVHVCEMLWKPRLRDVSSGESRYERALWPVHRGALTFGRANTVQADTCALARLHDLPLKIDQINKQMNEIPQAVSHRVRGETFTLGHLLFTKSLLLTMQGSRAGALENLCM